jgi:hypothetical protein
MRKLVQIPSGELILTDLQGTPFVCPYQNAVVVPGQLQGQLMINRPPCSSACSLFSMENIQTINGEKVRLTKNCCPQHDVEVLTIEKNEKNSILQ